MAGNHKAGGQGEPHAARMGELLPSRHRQQGVSGTRQLHSDAVAPVVAVQAQNQAPQVRALSTLASLRALRARTLEPAWARRAVGEGVKFCPREAMGRAAEVVAPSSSIRTDGGCPVAQVNDLSRSLTAFDPISTLVVVVEMSKASWLVSGVVPGVERQPLKKLEPDATALLRLIERWRNEAVRAGRPISRIALAYEAGRDGFWLARWLIARGIEAHVIHSASVAVSRERQRAQTERTAGARAYASGDQGACHPFGKRCGVTRAQAGEDGPTGCGDVDARIPGMVAR